jgi:glutamate-1-semialdehyde 2,1-aminomutase
MVAGAAALDVLTEDVLARLNSLGDKMRDALSSALGAASAPFNVTGIGSINQLHCTLPAEQRNAAHDLLFFTLLERGFWIAQRGTICLSIANAPADVDAFVVAVAEAAKVVAAAV